MGTTKVTRAARYTKKVQQRHLLLGITNISLLGPKGLFNRENTCLVQCSKPRTHGNLRENLLLPFSDTSIISNCIPNTITICPDKYRLQPSSKKLPFGADGKYYQKPKLVKMQRTTDLGCAQLQLAYFQQNLRLREQYGKWDIRTVKPSRPGHLP